MDRNPNIYNDEVERIVTHIWRVSDVIRGRMDQDRIHVILFYLTLYKDGIIDRDDLNRFDHYHLSFERLQDSVNHRRIYDVYLPIINSIPRAVLQELLWGLMEIPIETLKRHFPDVFDAILFRYSDEGGRKTDGIIQPHELSEFTNKLIRFYNPQTVYNPFAGLASFGISLNRNQFYFGQELNEKTFALGLLRLLAHNRSDFSEFTNDDSIINWKQNQLVDMVISNPPFRLRTHGRAKEIVGFRNSVESFLVKQGYYSLNENGVLITYVPSGFLYGRSGEKETREFLVNQNLIDTVISMPSGLFSNTNIPFSILIIRKNREPYDKVRMIEASKLSSSKKWNRKLDSQRLEELFFDNRENESVRYVETDEIISNDYNLQVSRYFLEEIEGIELHKLIYPIRGDKVSESTVGKFVRIRDLKSSSTDPFLKTDDLTDRVGFKERNPYRLISEPCLLVAQRWKSIKPTIFQYTGEPIIISNDIAAFKVDIYKVDPVFLAISLLSESVSKQFEAFQLGGTIPLIRREDLLDIKVDIPLLVEQKVVLKTLQTTVSESEKLNRNIKKALEEQKQAAREDLESKQHGIRQHLKNVNDSLKVLSLFMEKNNGVLQADDIINKTRGITVKQRFEALQASFDLVQEEIENLTNDIDFEEAQDIDINKLIQSCIKQLGKTDGFRVNDDYFDRTAFQEAKAKPIVRVGKKSFIEVFNNIIENAKRHGFVEEDRTYDIRILLTLDKEGVLLKIANNGKPFPKDISDKLGIKGVKAGSTSNKGIGAWKIIETANHYKFKFEIIDNPQDPFPVGWIFRFKLTESNGSI